MLISWVDKRTSPQNCNIPGGMLWDGSGYHHVCAWECVGWMLPHLFPLLTQVLRINTWQPTGREGKMPSWTKPTLDRLIICLNASKSINYATPMWNKHIYLTRNSVETNTHVSTLHSMIRKQLSKIGQSTEWHFNTQSPVGVQISLRYSTLKCTRPTSPQYPVAHPGHQQLSCWTWHGWPESSQQ